MNKKFLSVVLFGALMAGSSVTFTGCIDNDEPAGIETLRGAKAELIRAKVAVEAANAALVTAQAEKVKAEAEQASAQAEILKAQAEKARLENELQTITNAQKKAEVETEIARLEGVMKENAVKHQSSMLKLQQKLAENQRAYDLALQQIAIAEAVLSEQDKVTLTELKLAVTTAQGEVDDKVAAVETAEEAYYNAVLDSKVDSVDFKRLELAVERKETEKQIAEETLAKWNGFLENDTETADWRKEITTLEDSVVTLNKKKTELEVELAKLEYSEAYKALIDAKVETENAYVNLKTDGKLTYETLFKKGTFTVVKGTPVSTAIANIAGPKADCKENGYVYDLKTLIADYTSEKKALLDEIADATAEEVKDQKKKSDDAIAVWKAAKSKYDNIGDFNVNTYKKNTLTPAVKTQIDKIAEQNAIVNSTSPAVTEAMKTAAKNAIAGAEANIAKALVDYATEVQTKGYATDVKTKLTYIVVENGQVVTKNDKEKTVVAWLSDSSNAAYNLEQLANVEEASELTVNNVLAIEIIKDVIATPEDILGKKLQIASDDAFGKASLYGKELADQEKEYMRVEPTKEEVIAAGVLSCGKLGLYYAMTDEGYQYEAKNYEAIIADYEAAVTYWTEQLATLAKAKTDAYNAMVAAADAIEAYEEENFAAIRKEIDGEIGGRIHALNKIKEALIDAVNAWLPEDASEYENATKFEAWLKKQIEEAENNVIKAEKAVVKAENDLIKAKDGKYDKLSEAKAALDEAMAELEAAQVELATATANLQKGLEVMANYASAE